MELHQRRADAVISQGLIVIRSVRPPVIYESRDAPKADRPASPFTRDGRKVLRHNQQTDGTLTRTFEGIFKRDLAPAKYLDFEGHSKQIIFKEKCFVTLTAFFLFFFCETSERKTWNIKSEIGWSKVALRKCVWEE